MMFPALLSQKNWEFLVNGQWSIRHGFKAFKADTPGQKGGVRYLFFDYVQLKYLEYGKVDPKVVE